MLYKTAIIYANFLESDESVYICTVWVWLDSKFVPKFKDTEEGFIDHPKYICSLEINN